FLALIKTAVMDSEAHSGKCLQHVCRCDPVFRIFRMIIITVHGKAVCGEEIVAIAIVILVLRAHIVVTDCSSHTVCVHDNGLMRIRTVSGIADEISAIQGKHQSYTSSDSSSSTFVINFRARIMVSSSQSPPRVTSKPLQPNLSIKGVTWISVLPSSEMRK